MFKIETSTMELVLKDGDENAYFAACCEVLMNYGKTKEILALTPMEEKATTRKRAGRKKKAETEVPPPEEPPPRQKRKEVVYMRVTKDKFQLPMAVASNAEQLARMCGVDRNYIDTHISRVRSGKIKKPKFIRVELEEDE